MGKGFWMNLWNSFCWKLSCIFWKWFHVEFVLNCKSFFCPILKFKFSTWYFSQNRMNNKKCTYFKKIYKLDHIKISRLNYYFHTKFCYVSTKRTTYIKKLNYSDRFKTTYLQIKKLYTPKEKKSHTKHNHASSLKKS